MEIQDVIDVIKNDKRALRILVYRSWHEKIIKTIKILRKELKVTDIQINPRELVTFIRSITNECKQDLDEFIPLRNVVKLTISTCLKDINGHNEQVNIVLSPRLYDKIINKAMSDRTRPSW